MTKTIVTQAKVLYEALESRTRNNGDVFYALKDNSPEWMTDVIHAAHGDSFPDDTIYKTIRDIASHLSDLDEDTDLYDAVDSINEIEPEIYTAKLTHWLSLSLEHYQYMQQAMDELGPFTDAFALLQAAQKRQIQAIGNALVDALDDTLTDDDDDESFEDELEIKKNKENVLKEEEEEEDE